MALQADDVGRYYEEPAARPGKRWVLRDVDCVVRNGEILAVLGRNGVGKTTLLRVLVGLDEPQVGTVSGIPSLQDRPGHFGICFQEIEETLLPWRTNLGNAAAGLEAVGCERAEARRRVGDFVDEYGLEGVPWDRTPGLSSGGERQMVSLVRACVMRPRILAVDEPLSRIDPAHVWEWREFLLRFVTEHEVACLIVTHSLDDALYVADRVQVLAANEESRGGASLAESHAVSVERHMRRAWRRSRGYQELRANLADALEGLV